MILGMNLYLLLLTQSLVRLACHTRTKFRVSAKIRANYSLWFHNTDCLSVFLWSLRTTTQFTSGDVDKMGGIFV